MKWWLFIALLAATGCQTALTPGSVYRRTDRIVDLLAEPTFDVGADPNAIYFYSFRVPHYDADGHGIFDVPVVAGEQIMFAPAWLFASALRVTGSEPYLGATGSAGSGAMLRKGAGWAIAVPGIGFYYAGLGSAMGIDLAVHDAPVIVIGRPLRWLGQAAYGE